MIDAIVLAAPAYDIAGDLHPAGTTGIEIDRRRCALTERIAIRLRLPDGRQPWFLGLGETTVRACPTPSGC